MGDIITPRDPAGPTPRPLAGRPSPGYGGPVQALNRIVMLAVVLAIAATTGVPAQSPTGECGRFAIESLSIGSPVGLVRARLGREGVATNNGTTVEYVVGDRAIQVRYDHRIDRKPEAKIAMLRTSIQPTDEAIEALVRRFGPPSSDPKAPAPAEEGSDGATTQATVVWLDPTCGVTATVYRRVGSWWSGDVGTFLQLERLEAARPGASPPIASVAAGTAAATVAAPQSPPVVENGARPPAAELPPPPNLAIEATVEAAKDGRPAAVAPRSTAPAPIFTPVLGAPVDRLPERIAAAPPIYPANLRLMGVRGTVRLSVTVRVDGLVGDVQVTKADPPGRGFEAAALAAVKRWRYKPATLRSVPTEAEIEVVIEFK